MAHGETIATLDLLVATRVGTYLDVASTSLLLYDYLLTFNLERTLVWPGKWNLGKALFFLTRYLVVVDLATVLTQRFIPLPSIQLCSRLYQVTGWLFCVGIAIAQAILSLRTWAIWGHNKFIGALLGVTFVSLWSVILALGQKFIKSLVFVRGEDIDPSFSGCILFKWSSMLFVEFTVHTLLVGETVVFVLTVIQAIRHFKHGTSHVLSTLFKEGIFYFFYIFAFSFANCFVVRKSSTGYAFILVTLQRVVHSSLSARILLHLRQFANSDLNSTVADPYDIESMQRPPNTAISSLNFALGQGPRDHDRQEDERTSVEIPTSDDGVTWVEYSVEDAGGSVKADVKQSIAIENPSFSSYSA